MDIKQLITWLSAQNISEVSRNTGIPNSRMYKWIKGEGSPKTKDYSILLAYHEKIGISSNTDNTPLPTDLQVKEGKKKDVKLLGKHVPLRLKPEEYAEAFGDWPGLPMYNAPVTASFVETYRDESVYKPQYYLHDPRFRDCDFGAIITGDSMHSEIRHGDFIACKEVKDTRFIVYGDIYYVVATNGLETCKYVNVDPEDRNNLLLVARSEKISPSPLPKDMIHKLYKVRGIVRGY